MNDCEKMSEKKRSRRRKDEYTGPGGVQDEIDKPSKEEYTIAKWLKNNVRTKRTKFLSHNVEYFTATKALDALMNSKFAQGENCLFPTREHAIEFLDIMLEHKFFHRAKKVPVFPEDLKGGKAKKPITEKESTATNVTSATTTTKKDEKEKEKLTENAENSGNAEGNAQSEEQTKEKRKRKIKLDMHREQVFVDGSEAYVWIYDPVPIHYWIYGLALVLGGIIVCLFPLWPPILRKGVYYLSIAAAGFLVFILVLTVIRLIIFVTVWALSGGKLYFWIFPNLTEDVGFVASFWPLYESEYCANSGSSKSNKKSKKKKKDKDSDAEDECDQQTLLEPEKIENIKENETGSIVKDSIISNDNDEKDDDVYDRTEDDNDDDDNVKNSKNDSSDKKSFKKQDNKDEMKTSASTSAETKENTTPSESESEGSRSSTGKDFEIVDALETET